MHGKVYKRNYFLLYMQVKLLHDLVEEMAGENTGRIVDILFGKKDVNEFSIAKKMELTINQVRNILYKLSADGLVSFIRKKDKRKGWYIYYWTLKTEKCLVKLEGSLVKKIEGFRGILGSRETRRFYTCPSCGIEVGEEKALEHGFSCEECAEIYELSDNSPAIRETKFRISRTQKNLELIQGELVTIREKEAKRRARINKKLDKEEAERKALMKIARAAARKKVAEAKAKLEGKTLAVKKKVKKTVKKVKGKVAAKKKVVKKTVKKVKGKVVKKVAAKKKIVKKVAKKIVKKKISLAGRLKKKISGKR
jgi:transcription factor E